MVLQKEFCEKVHFEKKSADNNKVKRVDQFYFVPSIILQPGKFMNSNLEI